MTALEGEDLLICVTCGTQFDVPASEPLSACRICEDPRQFVPPTGQKWTSLARERGKHTNKFQQDERDDRIWSIFSEPKLGIGERGILLKTDHGNVMWDCIAFLDQETIDFINSQGGLSHIIISHPHFYTTHLTWARAFGAKIHVHAADEEWLNRVDHDGHRSLIREETKEIVPGVTAIRTGGHFEGSMVLHWNKQLFIADSFVGVPSGFSPHPRPKGMTTYSFLWSIPNMIPLDPDSIHVIWKALKPFDFEATHGLFPDGDIRGQDVKARVLESMQIQVRRQGFRKHALLDEVCKS